MLRSASRTTKNEEKTEKVGESVWDRGVGVMHCCYFASGRIRRIRQFGKPQVRMGHSCILDHYKDPRCATHEK